MTAAQARIKEALQDRWELRTTLGEGTRPTVWLWRDGVRRPVRWVTVAALQRNGYLRFEGTPRSHGSHTGTFLWVGG